MFARSKRPSVFTARLFTLATLSLFTCSFSLPAWAQADKDEPAVAPDEEEEEEEAPKASGEARVTADTTATEIAKPKAAAATAEPERAAVPVFDGLYDGDMRLGWDGSAEIDVGYARYEYELAGYKPERFYDFRGRFVVGPVLEHDFDEHHFFRATGQVVAWVREEAQLYQVNADDVYVQAGRRKSWDLKLGRFESWSVYHKGLGFDIYTLDDTGALREPNFDTKLFGVDMYEVNAVYWREMAGKAALHVYPVDVLGFELVGLYGSERTTIHLGARAAADLNLKFLRLTAAAEYRTREPSEEVRTLVNGVEVPCDKCSDRALFGFGGGAIAKLGPLELGVNGARSSLTSYQTNGADDLAGSNEVTTLGGYLQVDAGTPLFDRALLLGGGVNRTELLIDNGDFEQHYQSAAFIAFPLGFNDAMIKLVLSKADLLFEDADPATGVVTARNSDMLAGRVRVRCSF